MRRATVSGVALLTCCVILFQGCVSYPERMRSLKTQFALGVDDSLPLRYDVEDDDGGNRLLALSEKGRLEQLQGRYRESSEYYQKAIEFSDALEDKALVSVGDALQESLAATYGNDLALDYPVVGFERMMLHQLDAFNRLAIGDLDGFGVNIRHLEKCRNDTVRLLRRDLDAINAKLGKERMKELTDSDAYKKLMGEADALTSGLQRSTDNVYALYLMGLYHEIRGEFADARMAYSDIEKLRPGFPAVKEGLARMGGGALPSGEGEVIVFFEEGFIPPKRDWRFEYGGLFTTVVWDVPYYSTFDCMPYEDGGPLLIVEGRRALAKTSPMCDLATLAVKAHDERMRGIIARQISRTAIKAVTRGIFSGMALAGAYCAARGIGDNRGYTQTALLAVGVAGSIGMAIMAAATEQADLRSWLLLPRQVQIARFPMKAGQHLLMLGSVDKCEKVVVDVKPGMKTIVYCTSVPGTMHSFSRCMDKIK